MLNTTSGVYDYIKGMTAEQILMLIKVATHDLEERKTKIEHDYGKLFCDAIGVERILDLPEVNAEDLNLVDIGKYPSDRVTPSMLKEHSAVRGITDDRRPFIAIRIELIDRDHQVVDQVVEVIFKRYSLNGDGKPNGVHEGNYVSALNNKTEEGISYSSKIYTGYQMNSSKLCAVRDLLDGKEILSPVDPSYFIRKA